MTAPIIASASTTTMATPPIPSADGGETDPPENDDGPLSTDDSPGPEEDPEPELELPLIVRIALRKILST